MGVSIEATVFREATIFTMIRSIMGYFGLLMTLAPVIIYFNSRQHPLRWKTETGRQFGILVFRSYPPHRFAFCMKYVNAVYTRSLNLDNIHCRLHNLNCLENRNWQTV